MAVVVEAVCGVRAASATVAVMGPLGDREVAEAQAQAEGMWQAAFEEDGEIGQVRCTVYSVRHGGAPCSASRGVMMGDRGGA